tara:strand:+ start:4844 stop:6487 length:1644 start_codon:yes stop_codon:yes gene_type:complete
MRVAKIGTIMPWGGDGGTGFLASNIPKGWIVCTGQTLSAADYPLLASVLGDTYGGDMTDAQGNHPEFPYYGTEASFRLPQISNSVLMDLERQYLYDPDYQMGQPDADQVVYDENGSILGDLIADYGETVSIRTTHEATADIDFTLNLTGNLYFKFTNITLSAPDFLETIHTLNRKLGINHTPSHGHSDRIASVNATGAGPMPFRTDEGIVMTGSASTSNACAKTRGPNTCALEATEPTTWQNGAELITFYGDGNKENTLPRCDSFMEFIQDSTGKNYWGFVPAGEDDFRDGVFRGSGHASDVYTQTLFGRGETDQIVDTVPVSTHKTPCHVGMFPRPMEVRSRPNFYGYDTGSPVRADGLVDDPETAPVFAVTGCLLDATNRITLPANTDLRTPYGTFPNNWFQWDAITPLMYVTPVNVDQKYEILREGTFVQGVVLDEATGLYEVTLNTPVLVSGTYDLQFRHGSYPCSLNLTKDNKNPLEQAFRAHNHGSFEIAQGLGSMSGPPSHTASDADGSSLQADSLENALNISCDVAQPNVTMTFIIKAY